MSNLLIVGTTCQQELDTIQCNQVQWANNTFKLYIENITQQRIE